MVRASPGWVTAHGRPSQGDCPACQARGERRWCLAWPAITGPAAGFARARGGRGAGGGAVAGWAELAGFGEGLAHAGGQPPVAGGCPQHLGAARCGRGCRAAVEAERLGVAAVDDSRHTMP